MRFFAIFAVFLAVSAGCAPEKRGAAPGKPDTGILVLAHGGDGKWNRYIEDAVIGVKGNFKKEIAFGMGDAVTIQREIDKLESAGIKKIVVIPLFLSSHSEMYRQVEYIFGLRDEPDILFWILMGDWQESRAGHGAGSNMLERVKFKVPYYFNISTPNIHCKTSLCI